jgi:hypothetical protein
MEVGTHQRGDRDVAIGLMGAGEDGVNEFVSDQVGIQIALVFVIGADRLARGQQVIDELSDDGQPQDQFAKSTDTTGLGFL